MWKLYNWLFGWDYIQWSNSATQGIARVYTDYSGKGYYWRYKNTELADEIKSADQVFWLTCAPDKYLSPELLNDKGE